MRYVKSTTFAVCILGETRPSVSRLFHALAEILDDTEREIAIYDRYGGSYGYVFYLMRKSTQNRME